MTSEERREARYHRRKSKRQANRLKRSKEVGTLQDVFNYHDMFFYGRKCCTGVRWKQSTQNFELHLFSGTAKRRREVLDGKWKQKKCAHFTISERGKVRPIDAPHIDDRQIHKVFTNEVLIPLYHPGMICDNLDLKSFFPNANRDIIYRRHQQVMLDPQIRAVADAIIDYAPYGNAPGRGMPLGVEPSQQEMVSLPSAIDNYIKCQLGLHCAGHYMDDYYVIYHDIEELKQIARDIVKKFESFGIRVNKKKCKIIPLIKPFRFCKARFTLTETGAIKINGSRDGVKRARRKLKMFHREYLAGKKTLFEIDQYMECQTAYYRHFDDHGRLLRLRRLHYAMFNRYREQEQLKKSA